VKVVDAKQRFLEALDGVVDPEEKRKIIGNLFIEVFEEEAQNLGHFDFLLQGTFTLTWLKAEKVQPVS